tara:strand:+ start:37 stop:666 length:630 start_codon:yes stop_codon:yes gene_type:complete
MPLFLKRISILVFLVIFSCEDDPSINLVKNGTFNAYPNQLIGEAVEKVMSNPKWESGIGIEGETKGKTLVNLTGGVTYYDKPVEILWQFVVDESNLSFESYAIEMNGIPQGDDILYQLLDLLFVDDATSGEVAKNNTTMTRNEVREAINGKSKEQVLKILGKPEQTQDLGIMEMWYYSGISYDPYAEVYDNMVQISFDQFGIVNMINFM